MKGKNVRIDPVLLTEYRRIHRQIHRVRFSKQPDAGEFANFAYLQGAQQALAWARRDNAQAPSKANPYGKPRESTRRTK